MRTEDMNRGIASVILVLAMLILSFIPAGVLAANEDPPLLEGDSESEEGTYGPLELGSGPVDVPDVKETFQGRYPGDGFGGQTAGVGDVDADGYDDFAVLVPSQDYCIVYKGGRSIQEFYVHPLEGTSFTLTSQSQVRPAGDLDFDGFDDILITTPGHYNGPIRAAGAVFVFYGSPSGLRQMPDQILFGYEEDMRFGSDVDVVGDINNDTYTDVIVGADGWNEDMGMAMLYLGGDSGLMTTPVWVWKGEQKGDRFGHAVTGAGDLNGDGIVDFAVSAPFATSGAGKGRVYIFYGTSNLAEMVVGKVLEGRMLKSYYGLSIRLAGDVNSDGFSDLLISAPEESGPQGSAGKVELYLGSEGGLQGSPKWTIQGESQDARFGFTIAFLGDVNRDGYDDVAIGAPFHTSYGKVERGKVYIFFGGDNGFRKIPSVVELGKEAGDHLSFGLAGAGDVDHNGFMDVLVGAPWADTGNGIDTGELYLFRGNDLTLPPLQGDGFGLKDPTEEDLILAEYRKYQFRISVTHRSGFDTLDYVDLHMDPDGEDVVLRLIVETQNLVEVRDPKDLVDGHFARPIESERYLDTTDILLNIKLHWNFPSGRPLTVRVEATDIHGLRVTGRWDDTARVVNRLTFSDEIQVIADRQGLLSSGDWVASTESLTFSGAIVEYDLSSYLVETETPYNPPTGTVLVVIRDDMGGEWTEALSRGTEFEIRALTPAESRPEMLYTISIESEARDKVFWTEQFIINVDGTPLAFRNPEPSSTIASLISTASIEIEDPLGPGPDPFSVQYQVDVAKDNEGWGPWTTASVSKGPNPGDPMVAEAYEFFTEGTNYIRWRAWDLVGNGPTASFNYSIVVDLGSISFSSPYPDSGQWHNTEAVAVGITVENSQGIDIDLDHIQYRISTSPGVYSDWVNFQASLPPGGDPSTVTVTTNVRMAEGEDNYIQWAARDLQRREYITSSLYLVRVDTTGPDFSEAQPSEDVFVNSKEVLVSVVVGDTLAGVSEDTIKYQVLGDSEWHYPDSKTNRGDAIECTALVSLQEGVDNFIRWQAKDVVGHSSPPFVQRVKVDLTPPTFSDFTPGPTEIATSKFIEVSVHIEDNGPYGLVSGVDLATLEYAVSRPDSGYSPWTHPIIQSASTVVSRYTATVIIELADGDENFIIWRVADASAPDAPMAQRNSAVSEPHRIVADLQITLPRPPVAIVTEPSHVEVTFGTSCKFNARESYSPKGEALTFLWVSDVDGVIGNTPSFSKAMSLGLHSITLTLRDESGLNTEHSFQINVVAPEEAKRPLSSIWEQVAVLVIVLCVLVTMLLQHYRIREI
jgi:hypothetical protein